MSYVPYESLAHAEADDVTQDDNLPTALRNLSPDQLHALRELVADGYARGLDAGFAMSDFYGDSLGELAEAYSAGFAQGKLDDGGLT